MKNKVESEDDGFGDFGEFDSPEIDQEAPKIQDPVLKSTPALDDDPFADILGEYGISDTKPVEPETKPAPEAEATVPPVNLFEMQEEAPAAIDTQNENDGFGSFDEPKTDEQIQEDDGFGDFGDFEGTADNAQNEEKEDLNINSNIFEYKAENAEIEEASIQEEEVAPKPKIELNENNLLGGFMAEFKQPEQSPRGDSKSLGDDFKDGSFTTRSTELKNQVQKIFENEPDYAKIGSQILKELNEKTFFENQ